MPELAACALGAPQEDPVGDDPAADPGPKGYEDLVLDVLSGPVAELAPGRRVGVVLDRDPHPGPGPYLLVQAYVLYLVQVGREDDRVLRGHDQAGHRQANRRPPRSRP